MTDKSYLLNTLSKNYKSGYYWLVYSTKNGWGICTSKPRFETEKCEKYFVHPSFVNSNAKVDFIEKEKPRKQFGYNWNIVE